MRLDVVLGQMEAPEMVFDLKTGSARLSKSRVDEIRAQLPMEYKGIPIVGIRVD